MTPAAGRTIKKIAKSDGDAAEIIDRAILELPADPRPHGVDKIRGRDDLYRVRRGDYRIVYSIDDDRKIIIKSIGNRKDFYCNL